MSDQWAEKLLDDVAREVIMLQYPQGIINMEANEQAIKEHTEALAVLKRRLLPLLLAGQDLRDWNRGIVLASNWDAAKQQAMEGL